MTLEEFQKKILNSKQSNISKEDKEHCDKIFTIQQQYGIEYEPINKPSIFGAKTLCPNCKSEIDRKYLGFSWDTNYGEYVHYSIYKCDCGYEYVEIKRQKQ